MTNIYYTGGYANTIQSMDATGIGIAEYEIGGTNDSLLSGLNVFDVYNNQIPIETVQDRLAEINNRSHKRFGEAWSKLAKM